MKGSIVLAKIGGTLWVILAGGSVVLVLLHWLGVFDAQVFNWRAFATLFGVGGLVCFVVAGVLSIWESEESK